MGSEVAGHVGVHVAEAVQRAQGQVKDEASEDGQNSSIWSVLHRLVHPPEHSDNLRCKFCIF